MTVLSDTPLAIDTTAHPGRFVVVHVLRTVTGVNLNAGRDGSPKTLTVGDSTRLRVSSQAIKRAMRTWMTQHTTDAQSSVRTRRIPGAAAEIITTAHPDRETADVLDHVDALLTGAGFTVNAAAPDRTAEITFAAATTPDKIAHLTLEHWDELADAANANAAARTALDPTNTKNARTKTDKEAGRLPTPTLPAAIKSAVHAAYAPGASLEIALAGRMLTAVPGADVDAAMSVAHAYSVDPIKPTNDFFSAVDDWQDGGFEDAEVGAMIGETVLASGTLYQWAVLDRTQLRQTLSAALDGDDLDEAVADGERLFVTAMAWALPTGHSHSTAANPAPELVVAAATDQLPLSAPVFEEAILDGPVGRTASHRLAAWLLRQQRHHPLTGGTVLWGDLAEAPDFPEALTVEEL